MTRAALWLQPAFDELILGVDEVGGPDSNPRIDAYLATVGLGNSGDETPWCSAFVTWALGRVGIAGTGLASARSYLRWGETCEAKVGAVAVLWRISPDAWQGHVGFLLGWNVAQVYLLGGNQGDSVSVTSYPRGRVLNFRWPKEWGVIT